MRFCFGWECAALILFVGLPASFAAKPQPGATLAARLELLEKAFNAFADDQGRWAYTETHSPIGVDGEASGYRESVFRVDPSQPYSEQFVPVKLGGKPPAEKDLQQWAKRSENAAKRRQKAAADKNSATPRNEDVQLLIFNQQVIPELEHAVVVTEDENGVTYEVPLRKAGGPDAARFEQFQLTVRVSKQHQFERVTIRQRSPMRAAAGKYSDGLIEIEFGLPDPRFPAVPTKISSRVTNKPMFGKAVTMRSVSVRRDFRHVTPYDERFGVELGPIRMIQF